MQPVGRVYAPCKVCEFGSLKVHGDDFFDGVVLSCPVCGFEDFIVNPFGDIRILLDMPKNWCLVYAP